MVTATQAPTKLDLACGQRKQEGFTGIDIAPIDDVDIVHDLSVTPWPIETSTIKEAFSSHFVEHVPDLMAFMDELYRVLEPDGTARLVHPYLKSDRAFQDPTHVRFIPDAMWWYFNREWREEQKLDHYPIDCDFEIVNIAAAFNEPWNMKSLEAQQFAVAHYWNVCSDLTVDLRAIK